IIQIMQYHIFPRFNKVVVERDEKFGGDMEFSSLEELKSQYASGELHPADLKTAAANYLNKLLRKPKNVLYT
ncbi:MAG: tyrosine--tRNA ligase, partial [Archaeoglobaceae archaeon]